METNLLKSLDSQIARFIGWCEKLPAAISSEINEKLIPLILFHIYIDILQMGSDKMYADNLLDKYIKSFSNSTLLTELRNTDVHDFKSKHVIVTLRSGPTVLELSAQCMNTLKEYFTKEENIPLLKVLQKWVKLTTSLKKSIKKEETGKSSTDNTVVPTVDKAIGNITVPAVDEAIGNITVPPVDGAIGNIVKPAAVKTKKVKKVCKKLNSTDKLLKEFNKVKEDLNNAKAVPLPVKIHSITDCQGNQTTRCALNNNYICAGTERGEVKIWKITNKKNNFTEFNKHSGPITSLCFSKNELLLSGSADTKINLYKENKNIYTYCGHSCEVGDLACSMNNFASASSDLTVKLWDFEYNHPLRSYIGHAKTPMCVQFHPNGLYMASGSMDNTIRLWCNKAGACVRILSDFECPITSLAFSPDGQSLAAGGVDSNIRIWDIQQGICKNKISTTPMPVSKLTWSSDGTYLAAGAANGHISLFDMTKDPVIIATYTPNLKSMFTLKFLELTLTCVGTVP